jgi:hypothetical protein
LTEVSSGSSSQRAIAAGRSGSRSTVRFARILTRNPTVVSSQPSPQPKQYAPLPPSPRPRINNADSGDQDWFRILRGRSEISRHLKHQSDEHRSQDHSLNPLHPDDKADYRDEHAYLEEQDVSVVEGVRLGIEHGSAEHLQHKTSTVWEIMPADISKAAVEIFSSGVGEADAKTLTHRFLCKEKSGTRKKEGVTAGVGASPLVLAKATP